MAILEGSGVDLTNLFKSCVKTIRMRNKAIGVSVPQSKLFPSPPVCPFFMKARDIQANISSHDILLAEHKKKYLQVDSNSFSDAEILYMEKVITKNLKIIEENIRTLESEFRNESEIKLSNQAKECQQNIINIIRANFLKTNATFRDMRDHRLKKENKKNQLLKLHRPRGSTNIRTTTEEAKNFPRLARTSDVGNDHSGDHKRRIEDGDNEFSDKLNKEEKGKENKCSHSSYLQEEMEDVIGGLSEEDRQLLEQENSHLYRELVSNQEEVKQITKQVVELSKMQDLLTENVEIQAQQIEEIHDTILSSTDNVQIGNEQVREAMRKDAGFRIWIMFFLIIMSCTILFLDWYNP